MKRLITCANPITAWVPTLLLCMALLVLSVIFAYQRIIFADNALHVFWVTNIDSIGVMAGRWPTSIVRLPLWIGTKLDLPLSILIYLYSTSHALLISILLVVVARKHKEVAWVSVGFYALVCGHTFFWCVSELIPSLLLLFLFADSTKTSKLLLLLIAVLALWSHPQSLLAIVFVAIMWIRRKDSRSNGVLLLTSAVSLYGTKGALFPNWYDTAKQNLLKESLQQLWSGTTINLPSVVELLSTAFSTNPILIIILSIMLIIYMIKRRYYTSFFLLVFTVVSLSLYLLTNRSVGERPYLEATMYLIAFYFAYAQIVDPIVKRPSLLIITSIVVFFVGRVLFLSTIYEQRLEAVISQVRKSTSSKCVLSECPVGYHTFTWGLPFETLLASQVYFERCYTAVIGQEEWLEKQKSIGGNIILNGTGWYHHIDPNNEYYNECQGQYLHCN